MEGHRGSEEGSGVGGLDLIVAALALLASWRFTVSSPVASSSPLSSLAPCPTREGASAPAEAAEAILGPEVALGQEEGGDDRRGEHHRAGEEEGPVGPAELLEEAQADRQGVEPLGPQVEQRGDEVA